MSDIFDDEVDAEPDLSIWDYMNTVEEEELNADLILEGEGRECTYSEGYVKRQEIFSCLTCSPDGNVGVCKCCSLVCHDGHEILELRTKRNFRCDCGNSKFGQFFCKLLTSKDVDNPENLYNHNFKGNYCTCDRPDPDPNVEEHSEMIQCCICEDWFHEGHIGPQSGDKIPRDEEGWALYEDFICQGCATVCSFLTCYPEIISTLDTPDTVMEKDDGNCSFDSSFSNTYSSYGGRDPVEADPESLVKECSEVAGPSTKCIIGGIIDNLPTSENSKPLFLSKRWRECLCRCGKCSHLYAQRGVGFLLDKEDSIVEYERMTEQKWNENIQKLEDSQLNFLNDLGHVEKMEFLRVIGDTENEIFSLLESSGPSRPITPADFQQIFENVVRKRRPPPKAHLNCRTSAGF